MKLIKFRQYHNGKFYYWGLGIKGSTFISPTNVDLMTIDNPHQQYTGLTDKNGVEIYEGDIFKTVMGWVAVVEWDEINARFLGFTLERERKILYVGREPAVEVIGNIYDNPELLTKYHKVVIV